MTRTERATFPRACRRDRSESKSGLDKSLRKGGGGQHNWGSIANEGYLEAAAIDDVYWNEDVSSSTDSEESRRGSLEKSGSETGSVSVAEEERRHAWDFRKIAFKGEAIDLSAIARTSAAASTSPTTLRAVPVA